MNSNYITAHRFKSKLVFLVGLLLFTTCFRSLAGSPPVDPILRLNLEGHSAQITQIEPTPDKKRLISISVDKSIKVWNVESLVLERTIRLPIASGFEGSLYALAVSPVGNIIAVSGLTGYTFEGSVSIYFVDIDSGSIVGRVSGLDEVVTNMRFSSSGDLLFAALSRNRGIRVVDVSSKSIAFSDSEYAGNTIGIEFLSAGRYVSSSHDGKIRFYDSTNNLYDTFSFEPEELPTAIRKSTIDGKLAVGFLGVPKVVVIDLENGNSLVDMDMSCFHNQQNTPRVFWNESSTRLYAYGSYSGRGGAPLYSWSYIGGVFGDCEKLMTSRRNFLDMDVLNDEYILFGTSDPSIGVLNILTGDERVTAGSTADFRQAAEYFRVSHTGEQIMFPIDRLGSYLYFDFQERAVTMVDSDFDGQSKTLDVNPRFKLDIELESELPASKLLIAGKEIPLSQYEIANDIYVESKDVLFLGTEFGVVKYIEGVEVARLNTVSHVEAINKSGDGKKVIVLLADGTVRWYSASNLEPLLSLFVDVSGASGSLEWVAWTSNNYYVSSNYGDSLIGWQLNNSIDEVADFFTALQYERLLYRPDIVSRIFQSALNDEQERSFKKQSVDLRAISPGEVSARLLSNDDRSAVIEISGSKRQLSMERLSIYNNGIPVLPLSERGLSGAEMEAVVRTIKIPLFDHVNDIRVEIGNGSSIGLANVFLEVEGYKEDVKKGDLYVVSIGVNKFVNANDEVVPDLNFAANDAHELRKAIIKNAESMHENIYSIELSDYSDESPIKENILSALKLITKAEANDTVIVFLASHGMSDNQGNYYFLPRDVNDNDVVAIFNGDKVGDSVIKWDNVLSAMNDSSGKRLLIVDTCYARSIEGPQDVQSLAKRSASSKFALIAAAKGDEESQELASREHGLFSWAFMQAMEQAPDLSGDSYRNLDEVFAAALPIVEKNRRATSPQTPQMVSIPSLYDIRFSQI